MLLTHNKVISTPTNLNETSQRIRQAPPHVRSGSFLMKYSRGNKLFGHLIEETIQDGSQGRSDATCSPPQQSPSMPEAGLGNFAQDHRISTWKIIAFSRSLITLFIYIFDKKFLNHLFLLYW